MRATRLLVVLLIPAFIAGALVVERTADDDGPSRRPTPLGRLAPTVAAPGARAATWFCAAGTALGEEGAAEQLLVLENAGATDQVATVTAFGDADQRASRQVELPAGSRTQLAVSSVVQAAWAGALVEVAGGEVAVQHVLSGPAGRTSGPCASSVSPTWHLPTGTTVLGVQHWLVVMNPFADEAVVDLSFVTETDTRTPPELQGMVVPGESVRAVDVSSVVTVREHLATNVVARSGLVVAEQVAAAGDDSDVPQGLAALLGAPAAALSWQLPGGPALEEGRTAQVVVFNPGDVPAEVDVQVVLDDPDANGVVEPFELTVRGGQYEIVDLGEDGRVPAGVRWSALAQSRNDVPVVVARSVRASGDAEPTGLATTLGSPVMAGRWEVPLGSVADVGPVTLTVVNPSPTDEARVTASLVADGASVPVRGATDVVVPAGEHLALDLSALGEPSAASLRIDASAPVVVEAGTAFADGRGYAAWPALVVDGTQALLPGDLVEPDTSPTVVLDGQPAEGTGPDDTGPGGTAPAATAPEEPALEEPASEEPAPGDGPGTGEQPADGAEPSTTTAPPDAGGDG